MSLFRAEWRKITGNRRGAALVIGIFPAGALVVFVLTGMVLLFSESFRTTMQQSGPASWTNTLVDVWAIPNSEYGRFILVIFAAMIFGGEFAHGTWKNLIPRRRRTTLVLMKYLVASVFVVVAFTLMSIIAGIGTWIIQSALGLGFPPEPTPEVFRGFFRDFGVQVLLTLLTALISLQYAVIGAMITRGVVGSIIIGFILVVLELGLLIPILLLYSLLNINLLPLFQLTPFYNLNNIRSLIDSGTPFAFSAQLQVQPFTVEGSLVVLLAWIAVVGLITILLFRRQDITG